MERNTSGGRKVEAEIEINTSPERIWRALTDATELARWFPLGAEVEPGEGGKIVYSWGELYPGEKAIIEKWVPDKRLKIVYSQAPSGEMGETEARAEAEVLAVDYHIEGRGGTTVLRLVHSGFGSSEKWDEWYDGTVRGWQFELRALRNYLENHYGRDRSVIWNYRSLKDDVESEWRKLVGPEGFGLESTLSTARPGDRYTTEVATGDEIGGVIQIIDQPYQFAATLDNFNTGLLRLTMDPSPQGILASVFINTYGVAGDEVKALERRLDEMMSRLFG